MNYELQSAYDEAENKWDVTVSGEIDIYNSEAFKGELYKLFETHESSVFIDCENLKYIDSTGLGTLVSVLKRVKQFEGSVHLSKLKPNVKKVFKITDLNKVFEIEGDVNE